MLRGRGKQRGKISKWCKKISPPVGRLFIILALNRNLKITFMPWPLLQEKTVAPEPQNELSVLTLLFCTLHFSFNSVVTSGTLSDFGVVLKGNSEITIR